MRWMLCGVALLVAAGAGAQTPPSKTASPGPERDAPPDTYAYDAAGRRDPFMTLLGTGTESRLGASRADGAAGLTVGEVSVRGIIQSRGVLVAMVQGPDNKTYLVHQGDRFVDGTLKSITSDGLVFVQVMNDPLSLVKQREIRKPLRSVEGGKP